MCNQFAPVKEYTRFQADTQNSQSNWAHMRQVHQSKHARLITVHAYVPQHVLTRARPAGKVAEGRFCACSAEEE